MEKLKPRELKQKAEALNRVGDFTTYKPSNEQAPDHQYQKQLKECQKQLKECQKQLKERRKQLGEISREEDDLRGMARNTATGTWNLRTSLRDFQANMQKAGSPEAQTTELETFRKYLRDTSSVSVISLDDMVKTDKYIKDVLSVLSERKKAQTTLNGMLAEQEKVQISQKNLSESMRSAGNVSEAVRQELERVSKETMEAVEQGERAIEGARETVEYVNKNVVLLRQRLDEHIEELKNTAQNIIDGCEITRRKTQIRVGHPEEMFTDEFKDLQTRKKEINEQIGVLEQEVLVLKVKISNLEEQKRLEEEQKRLEEEQKSNLEEQKRLEEEKVRALEGQVGNLEEKKSALEEKKSALEEKESALREKKRVLEEQKRLLLEEEVRIREEQMKELEDFLQGTKDSTSGEMALEENKDSTSDKTPLGRRFLKIVYREDPQRALAIFKLARSVETLSDTIDQEAESKESTLSALLGSDAVANISNYNSSYLVGVRSYIGKQNPDTLAAIEGNLTRAKQVFQSYLDRQ